MATNFQNGQSAAKNGSKPAPNRSSNHPGAMVKPVAIPALQALEHQLDTQRDNLEAQARQLVQTKMAETRLGVQGVVIDELATITADDDFFGFSSMFGAVSIPALQQETDEEHPAIEVLAAVN